MGIELRVFEFPTKRIFKKFNGISFNIHRTHVHSLKQTIISSFLIQPWPLTALAIIHRVALNL